MHFSGFQLLLFLSLVLSTLTNEYYQDHKAFEVAGHLFSSSHVNCESNFITLLSDPGHDLSANPLISTPSGNLLGGGSYDDRSLLYLVDGSGNLVWAKHFNAVSGPEKILSIKYDSEGFIFGIGGNLDKVEDFYVFKYNPADHSLEWARAVDRKFVFFDIIEQGDRYCIVGNERNASPPGLGGDVAFRYVDKVTGNFKNDQQRNWNLGSADELNACEQYDGSLYCVGRFVPSADFGEMRLAISKVDRNGNEVWSRLVFQPLSTDARMYGHDIAMHNGYIYIIGNGDPGGTSITNVHPYIAKLDTLGQLLWVKECNIDNISYAQGNSIAASDDGLVAIIWEVDNPGRIAVTMDLDGEVIDSRILSSTAINSRSRSPHNVLIRENSLNTAHTESKFGTNSSIVITSLPLAGSGQNDCSEIEPVKCSNKTWIAPTRLDYDLAEYPSTTIVDVLDLTVSSLTLLDSTLCSCSEICDNGIDDDLDGLIDCMDPDVADSCCCLDIIPLDLGPDIVLDSGNIVTISLNSPYSSGLWSNGSTGQSIDVSSTGIYWAEVIVCDSTLRDSIVVSPSAGLTLNSNGCEEGNAIAITDEGSDLHGEALLELPNGDFLIGGSHDNSSLIIRIDEKGEIIRSVTIDALPIPETIINMIIDREGDLVCVGQEIASNYIRTSFILKLDITTLDIEWSTVVTEQDHNFLELIDVDKSLPYIIIGREHSPPSPGFGNDAMMRTIDRNTGKFTSDITKNYSLSSAESFVSSSQHEDGLYICGRYHLSTLFEDMRMAVSKFDFQGNEIWTRLVIHDENDYARIYGRDLVATDEGVVFVGWGDPNGTDLTYVTTFYGKLDHDGNLLWARRLNMSGISAQSSNNIEKTDQGYLIWGVERLPNGRRLFIHVDDDGELIASRLVSKNAEYANYNSTDNIVIKGSSFYSIHSEPVGSDMSIFFINHPIDGSSIECEQFDGIAVTSTLVQSPANLDYSLSEYNRSSPFEQNNPSVEDITLDTLSLCACEICNNGIDDDGDGLVDCDDPEVQNDCCCLDPVTPEILGDSLVCDGEISTLTLGLDYDEILWSSGESALQIEVIEPGIYSVSVVDSCGNELSATFEVKVLPVTYHSIDTVIIPPVPVVINSEVYNEPGVYTQVLQNGFGCDSILTINISETDPELCDNGIDDDLDGLIDCADPDLFDSCCCLDILPLDLGPDLTITEGDTAVIVVNDGHEGAEWSDGSTGLSIGVTEEGWYWAQSEFCDSLLIDSVLVTVFPFVDSCATELFIPNIFTPNGDGVNDHLEIRYPPGPYRLKVFRVFDRWGGIVFETTDPGFRWDGMSKGKPLNPGVYVYTIEVDCWEESKTVSGDITILR